MSKNGLTKKLILSRIFFSKKYFQEIKIKKVLQGGKP